MIYLSSLDGQFIWDDYDLILNDPHVKQPLTTESVSALFSLEYWQNYFSGRKGQYRPLRALSFLVEHSLYGFNPFYARLLNLFFHLACTSGVAFLTLQLLKSKGSALAAALLFAVHPIHVEAVLWVKNRTELFAAFFVITSFIFFVSGIRKKSILLYIVSFVLYLLALISKETAITAPLLMAAFVFINKKPDKPVNRVLCLMPFILAALLHAGFYLFVLRQPESGAEGHQYDLFQLLILVLQTYYHYLIFLVFPINLSVGHYMPEPAFMNLSLWLALFFLSLLILCFIKLWKFDSRLLVPFLWIFITLAPSSNIIPLTGRLLAEQRLYLPSVGFCMLAGALLHYSWVTLRKLRKNAVLSASTLFYALLACVMIFYVYQTVSYSFVWRDEITFFDYCIKKNPRNPKFYNNLGLAYSERGRDAEALAMFKKAFMFSQNDPMILVNLADFRSKTGEWGMAEELYLTALTVAPSYYPAYNGLGILNVRKGNLDKAREHFHRLLELRPDFADGYNNLANVDAKKGLLESAINLRKKAVRLDPDEPQYRFNLGNDYAKSGNLRKAAEQYEKFLDMQPHDPAAYKKTAAAFANIGEKKAADALLRRAEELGTAPTD